MKVEKKTRRRAKCADGQINIHEERTEKVEFDEKALTSLYEVPYRRHHNNCQSNYIRYRATVSDFVPSSKGGPVKNLYTRFVLTWQEKENEKKKEACSVSHLQSDLGWVNLYN
jgi:hypothetical protein